MAEEEELQMMLEEMGVSSIASESPSGEESKSQEAPEVSSKGGDVFSDFLLGEGDAGDAAGASGGDKVESPSDTQKVGVEVEAADALASELDPTSSSVSPVAPSSSSSAPATKEVSLSTLVHIMGMPTASQVAVLEDKVDMLSGKIAGIASKVDNLSVKVAGLDNEASLDRVDYQLTEIRNILKKVLPHVLAMEEKRESPQLPSQGDPGGASDKAAEENYEILSSETDSSEVVSGETEEDEFQKREAERIREKANAAGSDEGLS